MSLLADVSSDLQRLLAPVNAETPAGRDLDGTLELSALESAAREPDEAAVQGVELEDERNWRAVRDQALALLEQSKDLRVAVLLARALLQVEGASGFCLAVSFVCELTQRYWPEVYPPVDAADGDATTRINALQELVSSVSLAQLRKAQIATLPGLGPVSVNDVLAASASPLARPAQLLAAPSQVLAALERLGADELLERLTPMRAACEQMQQLIVFVREQTGHVLQLAPLTAAAGERAGVLDALLKIFAEQHARLAPLALPTTALLAESAGALRTEARAIEQRDDVIASLDRICAYYARVEPSSPVPLLLQRAKRLVSMDFLAIIRDLANEGLPQIATIAGVSTEEAS
jgi:type VI secretion system protein ImpA